MNCDKFKAICTKAIVAAIVTSGIFALGTQTASAQSIIATVPFAFSAGDQPFPAGTYQFTSLHGWSLSIRNVKGGGEKFFTVHPEENGSLGSQGSLTFRNSEGHQNLQAVYVPGTDSVAELLQHDKRSNSAKSDISLASAASSEKVTVVKQNAIGR